MCYICRNEITSKEGYSHFCQHFRASGRRCSECERCDLYGDEDEGAAIRRAEAMAETAWREQGNNQLGTKMQLMVYEQWLDALIDAVAL